MRHRGDRLHRGAPPGADQDCGAVHPRMPALRAGHVCRLRVGGELWRSDCHAAEGSATLRGNYLPNGEIVVNIVFRIAFVAACVLGSHGIAAAQKPSRMQTILEKACKDLGNEADRLNKAGKKQEAAEVEGVLNLLSQATPESVPKLQAALVQKDLVGEWVRPTVGHTYRINADGTVESVVPNGKAVDNAGKVTMANSTCTDVKWNTGTEWRIYRVDKNRFAVEEKMGGAFVNDGIVLTRK